MSAPGLDGFTRRHLRTWVETHLLEDERDQVEASILAFVGEFPDVLERGLGWTEIRGLAERDLSTAQ